MAKINHLQNLIFNGGVINFCGSQLLIWKIFEMGKIFIILLA